MPKKIKEAKTIPTAQSLPQKTLRPIPKKPAKNRLKNSPEFHRTKKVIYAGLILLTLLFVLFAFYRLILYRLPSPTDLARRRIPQTTKILDRSGKLLYNLYIDQNRTIIPLNHVPLYLRQASIAIEDKDFYKHGGINIFGGILRAVKEMIFYHKLQGGSTITQQLIKSALLSPERTIQRKLKEFILAILVEQKYSKDQILEMYLNQVPYGGTAWGIEAAAETYFGKPVEKLTLAESALLAGLPAAPTFYSPFGANPQRAVARQHEVLRRMVEDGYITESEKLKAQSAKPEFKPQKIDIKAPHFVMYVKDLLVQKYGEELVLSDGLKVTTTLDLDLQEYAQASLSSEVADMKNYLVGNGSALVTKPSTGEILAMIGSTDYFASPSGNVNVTTSLRSPGSSIKPLNYALGFLKRKITPGTTLLDVQTCFTNKETGMRRYCPNNYDYKFHGATQVRFALGNSYNIPAAKVLALNGLDDFIATASAMGITTFTEKSRYGLSLTLGGGEVKMTDMAVAFGVFANSGIKKELTPFLKIEDNKGKVLEEYKESDRNIKSSLEINGPRILPADVTYLISHILLDNNARSATFGPSSYLVVPGHSAVSVKTGTAEDKRDNWTIGYTSDYLTAVWVGNNDNKPMSPYLESGGSGAAIIWNKLMQKVLKDVPDKWPKKPDSIVGLSICSLSGLLPPDGGCDSRFEYFLAGSQPTEKENLKRKVWINKETDDLPKEGDPQDKLEEREEIILSDPTTKEFCYSCFLRHQPPAKP